MKRHRDVLAKIGLGWALFTCMPAGDARCDEPTAASRAFTSRDKIVLEARELLDQGKFSEAENLLRTNLNSQASEIQRDRSELLEIIQRMRYEYSLTPEALLKRLQAVIPEAAEADLQQWANESRVRTRSIDGQLFYFRREPQNIFLFSPGAQRRRAASGKSPASPDKTLVQHLAEVVAAGEVADSPEVVPVRHRITHTLTIRPTHPAIKPGALVRVWLPFAQEYRQQRDIKLVKADPEPKTIAPGAVDGSRVTGGAQRTVYFEQTIEDVARPLVFSEVIEFTSFAYYPKLDEQKAVGLPMDWNGAYLNERPPHLVFDPAIVAKTREIVGQETNPLRQARLIFHWVSRNIPWNAEDEYCIIPSLAVKGFRAGRGDCGVQNSLFITMCRIAGIPARWQSGFETKPGANWGMHDWAEIYIAPWGWLPADASYGIQPSDDPRIADFYLGHQDSYRWIINLDWGHELVPPKRALRSEPADFQRGEVEIDGVNLYYDAWETKTEVERRSP